MSKPPLPWKIYRRRRVVDALGRAITTVADPIDAEIIVTAVNSHKALLEAAKEMYRACDNEGLIRPDPTGEWEKAIAQAEIK